MGTEGRQSFRMPLRLGAREGMWLCRGLKAFPRVWSRFYPWVPVPQEAGRVPLNFDMPELGPRDPQAGHPVFPWLPALPSLPGSGLPGPKENFPTVIP